MNWNCIEITHKKTLQYCDRRWARCDEICMLALKKDIHSYSDSEVQKMTCDICKWAFEVWGFESEYNINCTKMKYFAKSLTMFNYYPKNILFFIHKPDVITWVLAQRGQETDYL